MRDKIRMIHRFLALAAEKMVIPFICMGMGYVLGKKTNFLF